MEKTRFETLQDAIKAYGAAAFENLMRCKGFGNAVIDSLPAYLGCDPDCVKAAPPGGKFDPHRDYGDEAFSFSRRKVIVLEPILFGVALTVKNFEDSGALWLRTAIAVEVTGDTFDVFVAQQPMMHVPLDYKGNLEPVLEAVYQEFMRTFRVEVLAFNDKRFETGIGFLANN